MNRHNIADELNKPKVANSNKQLCEESLKQLVHCCGNFWEIETGVSYSDVMIYISLKEINSNQELTLTGELYIYFRHHLSVKINQKTFNGDMFIVPVHDFFMEINTIIKKEETVELFKLLNNDWRTILNHFVINQNNVSFFPDLGLKNARALGVAQINPPALDSTYDSDDDEEEVVFDDSAQDTSNEFDETSLEVVLSSAYKKNNFFNDPEYNSNPTVKFLNFLKNNIDEHAQQNICIFKNDILAKELKRRVGVVSAIFNVINNDFANSFICSNVIAFSLDMCASISKQNTNSAQLTPSIYELVSEISDENTRIDLKAGLIEFIKTIAVHAHLRMDYSDTQLLLTMNSCEIIINFFNEMKKNELNAFDEIKDCAKVYSKYYFLHYNSTYIPAPYNSNQPIVITGIKYAKEKPYLEDYKFYKENKKIYIEYFFGLTDDLVEIQNSLTVTMQPSQSNTIKHFFESLFTSDSSNLNKLSIDDLLEIMKKAESIDSQKACHITYAFFRNLNTNPHLINGYTLLAVDEICRHLIKSGAFNKYELENIIYTELNELLVRTIDLITIKDETPFLLIKLIDYLESLKIVPSGMSSYFQKKIRPLFDSGEIPFNSSSSHQSNQTTPAFFFNNNENFSNIKQKEAVNWALAIFPH